ncbi:MAG: hypothetical protein CMJ18_11295 [Phycisphaeraceae bacterium]|nr:hypothetical protein [Phycisphaeraceae bacterium]
MPPRRERVLARKRKASWRRRWGRRSLHRERPSRTAATDPLEPLEPRLYLTLVPVIDLADLLPPGGNGSAGFVLDGASPDDNAGLSVSGAGDVNGDGFDDLIIGARGGDLVGNDDAGEAFVVFGGASAPAAQFDLSDLFTANGGNGTDGFVLSGELGGDQAGFSVSGAGDFNGDGFGDLLIGTYQASADGRFAAGETYLVMGKGTAFPAELPLSVLDAVIPNPSIGLKFKGIGTNDYSGRAVRTAGDVNGDGLDDLIIGAAQAGGSDRGQAYVVFGVASGTPLGQDFQELSNLLAANGGDGSKGFVIDGVVGGDYAGFAVSTAGDVNGDGFDDVLVGSPYASPGGRSYAGQAYLIFGRADGFNASFALSSLRTAGGGDGSGGFVIHGIDSYDNLGRVVSDAGDINGDGFGDIVIGTERVPDAYGAYIGQSYVIFGKDDGFAAEIEAAALNGTNGFTIDGAAGGDQLGSSVSAVGDVSGDGLDDLIIGASGADPAGAPSAGQSYLIYGRAGPFAAALDVADLLPANGGDGSVGTVINGAAANDNAGVSVSAAGDVNGDGFSDILIGAASANLGGGYSADGQSYVLFGDDLSNAVTQEGDDGANTLSGGAGPDVLIGGADDDLLVGAGGADVLGGGEGDDVLAVIGDAFLRIAGGHGTDTLRVDGGGHTLDLAARSDLDVQEIEIIDITGSGANVLILDDLTGPQEALGLSGSSNTLTVLGDADDVVHLGGGWTASGSQVINSNTFDVFTQDLATVNVLQPVLASIATFELSSLLAGNGGNGSRGFTLDGVAVADLSGYSVSGAGDINGDGFDDVIVGAPYAEVGATNDAGRAYVVFGKAGSFAAELDLSSLLAANGGNGSAGFVLNGIDADDHAGTSISRAGDVNGDLKDDLLVSAPRADPNNNDYAGEVYLVYGASSFPAEVGLGTLDGTNGYIIHGTDVDDELGRADQTVTGVGDVDGDGFDDVAVAADMADPNATDMAGETHVIFGEDANLAAIDALDGAADGRINLPNLNGVNGVSINGILMNDRAGYSISEAGDVNGDQIDDLVIGAFEADPGAVANAGAAYVIFGRQGGFTQPLNLVNLAATDGFVISGGAQDELFGASVGSAGDFNDDGFDDLVATADSGSESYVIFGSAAPMDLNVATLNGANGFAITGSAEVSAAGDVNGDGAGDLLLGRDFDAPGGRTGAGVTVVLYGSRDPAPALFDVSSLNGANGFVIHGIDMNDLSGGSISDAGDVNDDGFDDLIIGARQRANNAGQSYVLFGGDFTGAARPPFVIEVLVAGSAWTPGFLADLAMRGQGQGGFSIPAGSTAQLDPRRWGNLDRIIVRLNEPVVVPAGAISLTGILGPDGVANANVDYNPTITTRTGVTGSFEVVLELAQPIGVDRLRVDVTGTGASAVTDPGGRALDGEWTDTSDVYPSGDGSAGGDFGFRLDVLPGDVDGSGQVGADDLQIILVNFATGPPAPIPLADLRADLGGDLGTGADDLGVVLGRFTRSLPPGVPATARPAATPFDALSGDTAVLLHSPRDDGILEFAGRRPAGAGADRLAAVQRLARRAAHQPRVHDLPGRQAFSDWLAARWSPVDLRAHVQPMHGLVGGRPVHVDELALPGLAV